VRSGRFLDTLFVVAFFFAFLLGGFLLQAFFGQYLGVQLIASNNVIDGIIIEFIISVAALAGSFLLLLKKFERGRWHFLLLGCIILLVIVSFIIATGGAFPIFIPNIVSPLYIVDVLSLSGIVYGIRRVMTIKKSGESSYSLQELSAAPSPKSSQWRILLWSALIGSVAGAFALVTLSTIFGMYMEVPPPLLGQPFAYQALQPCNAGLYEVCPPAVINNVALAIFDYASVFLIAFLGAYLTQRALFPITSHYENSIKRNVVPIVLLVIALLFTSLSANQSISSGASLSQPHWPTPSGVSLDLGNISLYSGPATTSRSAGARMDIRLLNYHWTSQTVTISNLRLGYYNETINPPIYECESVRSCAINSTFVVAPYSSTVVPFYLGYPIQKGAEYSYNFTITSNMGGWIMASSPPNVTAT
jgi:hypothetical protein